MMPDQRPHGKVLLEDLLRLKRAERPSSDFWAEFERELHTRQLAAAVARPRWWFGLPRAFPGLTRFQVPMGAAAVLAVTFLMLRDHREPAGESALAPAVVASHDHAVRREAAPSPVRRVDLVEGPTAMRVASEAPVTRRPASREEVPEMFSWSHIEPDGRSDAAKSAVSPSARFIAANLAAVEPELTRMLGSGATLAAPDSERREPLAQLTSPRDARRERLFAYNAGLADYADERDEAGAGQRVASRINETQLYDTVRRLSGGGDRLTLKF